MAIICNGKSPENDGLISLGKSRNIIHTWAKHSSTPRLITRGSPFLIINPRYSELYFITFGCSLTFTDSRQNLVTPSEYLTVIWFKPRAEPRVTPTTNQYMIKGLNHSHPFKIWMANDTNYINNQNIFTVQWSIFPFPVSSPFSIELWRAAGY